MRHNGRKRSLYYYKEIRKMIICSMLFISRHAVSRRYLCACVCMRVCVCVYACARVRECGCVCKIKCYPVENSHGSQINSPIHAQNCTLFYTSYREWSHRSLHEISLRGSMHHAMFHFSSFIAPNIKHHKRTRTNIFQKQGGWSCSGNRWKQNSGTEEKVQW